MRKGRFATAEEAALEAARYFRDAPTLNERRAHAMQGGADGKRAQATVVDDDDSEDDTPLSKRIRS